MQLSKYQVMEVLETVGTYWVERSSAFLRIR